MSFLGKSNNKVSSRRQIQIKEVKEGILVLPGNEYRIIIETSSINFELKSEEEQDILLDSFQNFLNALPTTIQILVRSREIDCEQYLEAIENKQHKELELIYKEQMKYYRDFIQKLVAGNK